MGHHLEVMIVSQTHALHDVLHGLPADLQIKSRSAEIVEHEF